jgi:O-antigen/teichoic acid export membrane protein
MRSGLFKLLSITLSGKVVSVLVLALLARTLAAEHLAYIGLIPAVAGLMLAVFGFGVGTLLERDVPRLRVSDPEAADTLLRTGFFVASLAVVLMLVFFWTLVDVWTNLFLSGYEFDPSSIRLMTLPMAFYMFVTINGWMLIIRGEARNYGYIHVYGDIAAKIGALGAYFLHASEMSLFVGLALGQLPFFGAALWMHRDWLFRRRFISPIELVWSSRVFYVEANFTALRNHGDSLLVSSVLGPAAMAGYYVAKRVASQLSVFFSPLTSIVVPLFSSRFGHGAQELALVFRKTWSIAAPLFIWLASSVAAASPFLLAVVAGEDYAETWQTTAVLCYATAALAVYAICGRILLIIGSSLERFRIVVIHTALLATCVLVFRGELGTTGIALSWLIATVCTILVVRVRARQLGFDWPASTAVGRALVLCVPVPIIMLYAIGYGVHPDWTYLLLACGLSAFSLAGILVLQNEFEERAMLGTLPGIIAPAYRTVRRVTRRRQAIPY